MTDILLDEHVGRLFERVLRDRGFEAVQAKDQFGEQTDDLALLQWCASNTIVLMTNNVRDFKSLHTDHSHAGIFLYYDQGLPDRDPEGLVRAVTAIYEQYGLEELDNQLITLDEWYSMTKRR